MKRGIIGTNTLYFADCLEAMKLLEDNSVDSVVTDPPYGLSFMGKAWDYDVPGKEIWQECLRVLKPGGHLLSFGGSRTYHRMAVAIEDAGFDIRDQIMWIYGSGFPKGLNVIKQIVKFIECQLQEHVPFVVQNSQLFQVVSSAEKEPIVVASAVILPVGVPVLIMEIGGEVSLNALTDTLLSELAMANMNLNTELSWKNSLDVNFNGMNKFITSTKSVMTIDRKIYNWLIGLHTSATTTLCHTTLQNGWKFPALTVPKNLNGELLKSNVIPIFSAIEAVMWNTVAGMVGLNVNLKPAHEPIVVARKPLQGTVAGNVLEHGTGALNIEACRVPISPKADAKQLRTMNRNVRAENTGEQNWGMSKTESDVPTVVHPEGRWPANVIHDGSEEVLESFPDAKGQQGDLKNHNKKRKSPNGCYGEMPPAKDCAKRNEAETSAARFFYCAKASKKERNKGVSGIEIIISNKNIRDKEIWSDQTTTSEEKEVKLLVDTEISPPKVIGVSGVSKKNAKEWNTLLFGKIIMEQFQMDIKSTTKTTTNSITASKILNWLTHLLTNDITAVANLEEEFGINHVGNAKVYIPFPITIEEKMDYPRGASPVALKMPFKISVRENLNFHETVKPIALMQYLCRLVTPPGGTTLDPFMGSGTTGLAAMAEKFQFIGIEREPEYFRIAYTRIQNQNKETANEKNIAT